MIQVNKELTDHILKGDRKAFDDLFRLYYSRLCHFAEGYLWDHAMAENMVQDAFLLLWERHDTLAPDSNLPSWLLVVIKNNILNHLNRMKRQAEVEQAYMMQIERDFDLRLTSLKACDPEYMFSAEVEQIIQDALDALPEQCRKVIMMSRFEDMSNKEIAERLNLTVKGVEYHITNALKKLRHELKDYMVYLLFFA